MPMLSITFDETVVTEKEATALSEQFQEIVSRATGIQDVFVYADSPKIRVKAAPLELFIFMTETKISNEAELIATIKADLAAWKKEVAFRHPINLTLVPMQWKVEIGI